MAKASKNKKSVAKKVTEKITEKVAPSTSTSTDVEKPTKKVETVGKLPKIPAYKTRAMVDKELEEALNTIRESKKALEESEGKIEITLEAVKKANTEIRTLKRKIDVEKSAASRTIKTMLQQSDDDSEAAHKKFLNMQSMYKKVSDTHSSYVNTSESELRDKNKQIEDLNQTISQITSQLDNVSITLKETRTRIKTFVALSWWTRTFTRKSTLKSCLY